VGKDTITFNRIQEKIMRRGTNVTIPFRIFFLLFSIPEYKGKAIPLQALTGPEGSRRMRLPDFKTIGR
jgi:hypothetical protein